VANALYNSALIVGAGHGLTASLTCLLSREALDVALSARDTDKLKSLCEETGATAFGCDAQDEGQVTRLFEALDQHFGAPDVVIYNASPRVRGPLTTLDVHAVRRALMVSLSRYAELAADIGHRFAVEQLRYEPQALIHYRTLLPRHRHLPLEGGKGYLCVRR